MSDRCGDPSGTELAPGSVPAGPPNVGHPREEGDSIADRIEMISGHRSRLLRTLGNLIPEGPVALLGRPTHRNVGDQAIWLGQLEAIRALGGRSPAYACSIASYDPGELRRRLPHGTILLTGGGNLGDLYPSEQEFREQVLEDFPDRRVVVLPQSVRFRRDEALQSARRAFESHPELTLTVRTERSLEVARERFDVPVLLAPDMATALGPLPGTEPPFRTPLLCLLRRDGEASRERAEPARENGVRVEDWGDGHGEADTWPGARHWLRWRLAFPRGHHLASALDYLRSARTRHAWYRVSAGLSLLSGADAVITDRLHGHILATLLGVPHVALDNSYGKVHSYVRSWTAGCPLVRTATDLDEARRVAGELSAVQRYGTARSGEGSPPASPAADGRASGEAPRS